MLDLLALGINVHLVLELRPVGFHIGGATTGGAEVELDIKAAHTDGAMAFGAKMEFMLYFRPGFLEGIGLFSVPFAAIYLFARFGGTAPETA